MCLGTCSRTWCNLGRRDRYQLTNSARRRLADHPYLPAFCDADAFALPPREGAFRGAFEHPLRYHGCAVAQGVRTRFQRSKGSRVLTKRKRLHLLFPETSLIINLRHIILFQSISRARSHG